jgi:hypothetical protein
VSEGRGIDLRELVAALKHDLGKYVAWRSANLDEAAWTGPLPAELVEALRADVLRTRGEEPAWDVWRRLTAALPRPLPEPELVAVERAVEVLRANEAALRDHDTRALTAARGEIRAAQQRIREELRELQRRLAAAASDEGEV